MAITPSVTVLETTSKRAPASVFVDLTGTTSDATSYPFHELWYEVYYGDPSSGNFSANSLARSKNHRFGAFTAHLYETAGVYTITIIIKEVAADGTVTDEYKTTQDVTVYDPTGASGWAVGDRVVYAVDNDFTDAPAGTQKHYDPGTEYDWSDVIGDLVSGKMVYLKSGETYDITNETAFTNSSGPSYLTIWNGTTRAKLDTSGTAYCPFRFTEGDSSDVRIEKIEVDGGDTATAHAVNDGLENTCSQSTQQVTIHDCYFHDIDNKGIGLNLGAGPFGGSVIDHKQWLIHEVETYDTTYGIFFHARESAVLGCKFDEQTIKTNGEHNCRVQQLWKGEIADNWGGNQKLDNHCFTLRGYDLANGAWPLQGDGKTQYVVMSGNETDPTDSTPSTMNVMPANESNPGYIEDVVVESNLINTNNQNVGHKAFVWAAKRVTFRNNVIIGSRNSNLHNMTGADTDRCVMLDTEGAPAEYFWVYNNTFYNYGDATSYRMFIWGGAAGIIDYVEFRNNAHYTPNCSGTYDYFSGDGNITNFTDANNIGDMAFPDFHNTDPTEAEHCDIQAESSLVGQGSNRLGAFYDFFYRKRHYGGTIEQGAFEYRRTRLLAF